MRMLTLRNGRNLLNAKLFVRINSSKSYSAGSSNKDIIEMTSNETERLSKVWSRKQMPKSLAMKGARFETVALGKQPNPAPAIELIAKVPIIQVHENIVACDGGGEKLGHPKIYINLDQNQPISCTYCGLRYQKK